MKNDAAFFSFSFLFHLKFPFIPSPLLCCVSVYLFELALVYSTHPDYHSTTMEHDNPTQLSYTWLAFSDPLWQWFG